MIEPDEFVPDPVVEPGESSEALDLDYADPDDFPEGVDA